MQVCDSFIFDQSQDHQPSELKFLDILDPLLPILPYDFVSLVNCM